MHVRLILAAIFAICLALPLSAHHSHSNYMEVFHDMEGVVKEVHLVTPHTWIYMEVEEEGGESHLWALEATSRGALERLGVTRDYVKPGDAIKVRCHPLRDGGKSCLLGFLKAADGSVKNWDGADTPAPADF
jgi:hypothetical protein